MDLERFQQFMLESAAKHDAEIGTLRESMREMNQSIAKHDAQFGVVAETLDRVSHTLEVLVNNQVHLQETAAEERKEFNRRMDDFRQAFVLHAADPGAHRR